VRDEVGEGGLPGRAARARRAPHPMERAAWLSPREGDCKVARIMQENRDADTDVGFQALSGLFSGLPLTAYESASVVKPSRSPR